MKPYVLTVTRAPNTPPVADSQTVTVLQDQAEVMALTGSDEDGNALAYSLITQPAQGILTGLPPDLTYRPNMGVTDDDSFTFKESTMAPSIRLPLRSRSTSRPTDRRPPPTIVQ